MLIHSLKRIEASDLCPFDIEEVKSYLKIDHNLEDQIILKIMKAVVNEFEDYTAVALMSQKWRIVYKNVDRKILSFPIKPVIKIIKIEKADFYSHESQPMSYQFIQDALLIGYVSTSEFITVDFIAGLYPQNHFIPENIKIALLEHIAFLYENRGIAKKFDLSLYASFKVFQY